MATCILTPTSITEPLPIDTIFAPGAPLEVDVGAGKGRFLLARASANPDVSYLAIERMLGRVRKIDSKLTRHGLANVRIIRLEAFYALQFLLPPQRIRTVYIHFPDPWPKRRHHKRRLFSPEFLDMLHDRLEPGGTVQIATDHLDYFEAIRQAFARDARYRDVAPIPRRPEEQTDFELIFRGHGQPIGECAYRV
jgi:tRNA (guanine-N7-)-methyltransferase